MSFFFAKNKQTVFICYQIMQKLKNVLFNSSTQTRGHNILESISHSVLYSQLPTRVREETVWCGWNF